MGMNVSGIAMMYDSLVNLVTGLGTTKDKKTHGQFSLDLITKETAEIMFRGDWIARKAVNIPAADSTREWRLWKLENTEVEELEEVEGRFKIQNQTYRAQWLARLYGGAGMIMMVKGHGDPATELFAEEVQEDELEAVHVCNKHQLRAGPLQTNILKPYYMEPEYYERTARDGQMVRVHPSRVVPFIGNEMPDQEAAIDAWGESILQSVYDAIRAAASVQGGIATLVEEAKIDVISMPGLSQNLSNDAYTKRLVQRMSNATLIKSLVGALVIDEKEQWQQITRSFASLPEVIQVYLAIVSAAVDVPSTRFLGRSPQGLNATGESDIRNYYDSIGSFQKNDLTVRLGRLDEVMVRSATGDYDESLFYQWAPLWQMTEMEKAELAGKKSTVFLSDLNSGLFPIEVMQQARKSQIIEDGLYPAFEMALEEHGEDDIPRLEQEELNRALQEKSLKAPMPPPGKLAAKKVGDARFEDATPRTLFMCRYVQNAEDILAWAEGVGIKDLLPAEELHVTIAYSKSPIDWMKIDSAWNQNEDGTLKIPPGGVRIVERLGPSATVLMFTSSTLSWRHEDIKRAGGSWDYETYQPHITISTKVQGMDFVYKDIEPYKGEIILGPEDFQEIDEKKAY